MTVLNYLVHPTLFISLMQMCPAVLSAQLNTFYLQSNCWKTLQVLSRPTWNTQTMSRAAVSASNARSLYISLRWHCVGSPRGCLCITADGCHGNRCLHVLPGSPTHPQTPTHPKHARAQDRLRLKRRGTVGKVQRMLFNSCFSCPFPL